MVMTPPDNLTVQKWRRNVFRDYQRNNLFSEFIGNGNSAVIHRINELKDEGEEITIPLFMLPPAGGVSGEQTLVGNEHDLKHFGWKVRIDWWRDAILLNKKQQRRSVVDQMEEVRPALTQLAANKLRDDVIRGFHNVGQTELGPDLETANVMGRYYPRATPTQKNAWHNANDDRVVYGNQRSQYVAGDHAASLLNVDKDNDRFLGKSVKMMKRMAKKARPHLSPITVEGGREYFGTFVGSNLFRDFAEDPVVVAANKDARARGVDSNPIFQDGDLILNGVWVREIPEMDDLATIAGAGATGINVAPAWLVGRQAMGYAIGQLPQPTERSEDDYKFVKGRGVETCYGIGKSQFRNRELGEDSPIKDWGVVTGFFASIDDA